MDPQAGQTVTLAGGMTARPLAVVMADERDKAAMTQAAPLVTALAAYVRKCWTYARDAKIQTVEFRLLQNVRARRGEYDPEKLAAIQQMGGSSIYQMLTSVKCRAAGSWLRDVVAGVGEDRPWTIKPTVLPEMPPDIGNQILQATMKQIATAEQSGASMTDIEILELMSALKDAAEDEVRKQAKEDADRMADKMEEQLALGGFHDALDQFIDDLCTFPSAIVRGPIVRKKAALKWAPDPQNPGSFTPQVTDELKMEWERVSPFDMYPSPASTTIDDGYLIQKHRLSREDLNEMIGVDGYDDSSIRTCLEDYGRGGLREWLTNDVMQAQAEGKSTTAVGVNSEGLIDAIQFWGSVQGAWLVEWGMEDADVPDPTKEYHVEVWLIGPHVIKATLNPDPLHRKPYYKASYEDIPGAWWGNSVADLVRDSQTVMNAAARALVNNMGMASGPQVAINVSRLPPGEEITTLEPWKIWQYKDDPAGGAQDAIKFFQPDSNVQALMAVMEKFSELADEYSGVPRYMTGDSAGGAGRTASGLSMLVNNAGKSIKQVISNVDANLFTPLLQRLYFYNMTYSDDPSLKGDVNIIAGGADALMAKEAAQVRRNEFLAATNNPVDMQIVGLKGRAAILRETVKTLDMDPDDIIPAPAILEAMQKVIAKQAAAAAQAGEPPAAAAPLGLPAPSGGPPSPQGPAGGSPPNAPIINAQTLQNGAPITDHFTPTPKPG